MERLKSDILIELQNIELKIADKSKLDNDDFLTIFISDILKEEFDEFS